MAPRKSSSTQKETVDSAERVLEDRGSPEKVLPKEGGGAGKKRSAKSLEPNAAAAPVAQSSEKKQRKAPQGRKQHTPHAEASEVPAPLAESDAAAAVDEALAVAPVAKRKQTAGQEELEELSTAGVEAAEEVPGVPVEEAPGVPVEEAPGVPEKEAPGVPVEEAPGVTEKEAPAPSDCDPKEHEEEVAEAVEKQSLSEEREEEETAEVEDVVKGGAVPPEQTAGGEEGGETRAAAAQKEVPPRPSPRGSSCTGERFSFVSKEGIQNLFHGAKKPQQTEERRERLLGSAAEEHSEQEEVSAASSSGSLKAVPASPAGRPKSPPKRVKAFYCKFSQTNAFKSFFENLGNVLTEVSLEIRKEGGFAGIMADSMDASHVTLVQGKVSGEVKLNVPPEKAIFCVTVKDFLDIFPNVHPQHFIELYRYEGSTDICLRIFEPSMKTTNICIDIQTLDKSIDTLELNEMDYSFYVDVELNSFKNALKTAKNQGAESIQFLIYELEKTSDFREGTSPSKTMYFVIRYKGVRTAFSFPYESKVVSSACEEVAIHLKAIDYETEDSPDDSSEEGSSVNERLQDLKPLYQGTFLSRCLINFIKSMERSNLTLRLANEKPLIIDYPLGCSSTDGLRFVLAPTCPE